MLVYGVKSGNDLEDPRRFPEVAAPMLSAEDARLRTLVQQDLKQCLQSGRSEPVPANNKAKNQKRAKQRKRAQAAKNEEQLPEQRQDVAGPGTTAPPPSKPDES